MSKLIQTCRQGFSLLEVLVSVFVVLIGLLGVATMIPAGRYEMLQARKADMGADLSRAIMNSVITQISNGWNPNGNEFYVVANFADNDGSLAERLSKGINKVAANKCPLTVNDDRTFNGDDDVAIIEGDNNQFQLALDSAGKVVGTGAYTACATIVSLDTGYYEITGLAVYRYSDIQQGSETDAKDYKRGSYLFCADNPAIKRADNTVVKRWYKIDNVYAGRTAMFTTTAGEISSNYTYLGDVIGICRKVIRIDSFTPPAGN